MIGVIFGLTLRQVIGRRSTLVLLAFSSLPVVISIVFRLNDPGVDPERWTARVLLSGLVVTTMLPVIALFLGTSVLGNEIEDGTATYLLTKPVPRWQILAAKLAVAWLVTATFALASTLISGLVALEGSGSSIISGFAVAVVAGALAYSAVAVLLSIVTSRALIAGFVYVFLWEGVITGLFSGTRNFSIRHYCLSIADLIAGTRPFVFDADVSGEMAVALITAATLGATLLANRRLKEIEVKEPS